MLIEPLCPHLTHNKGQGQSRPTVQSVPTKSKGRPEFEKTEVLFQKIRKVVYMIGLKNRSIFKFSRFFLCLRKANEIHKTNENAYKSQNIFQNRRT